MKNIFRLHPNLNIRDNYERRDIREMVSAILQRITKIAILMNEKNALETK